MHIYTPPGTRVSGCCSYFIPTQTKEQNGGTASEFTEEAASERIAIVYTDIPGMIYVCIYFVSDPIYYLHSPFLPLVPPTRHVRVKNLGDETKSGCGCFLFYMYFQQVLVLSERNATITRGPYS